ncbi:MAG: endonuclease [Candidatus Thiodiazotropha endolucinida]|nr:endonuclease [Candidatus Thiodiazotropha endolucinida]
MDISGESQKLNSFKLQIEQAYRRYQSRQEERAIRQERLERLHEGGSWEQFDESSRIVYRLESVGELGPLRETVVSSLNESFGDEQRQAIGVALERIIEGKDLLGVRFIHEASVVSRSVGRIVLRSSGGHVLGYGTGFLVSPRLLLTNHHVLFSRAIAQRSVVEFGFYTLSNGSLTDPTEYKLEPAVFFTSDEALDYALVAVEPVNTGGHRLETLGWSPLIRESGKTLVGEPVNIIQHPGGEPQQIALRQNAIVDVLDDFLHYKADTEKGSSGSPVFNDRWELSALHHAGVPERDDNGRILLVSGDPWRGDSASAGHISWIANEGIRISRIVKHLEEQKLPLMTSVQRSLFKDVFTPRPGHLSESLLTNDNEDKDNHKAQDIGADAYPLIENGNATWILPLKLSVSLGPSSELPRNHSDRTDSSSISSPVPAIEIPSVKGDINQDEYARLIALVKENADRPYYDEQSDTEDIESYYESIGSPRTGRTWFNRLSELVRDTHHSEIRYRTARLEYLYPWVDLHPEDRMLKSIYSGAGFSPEELLYLELEIETQREVLIREMMSNEAHLSEDVIEELQSDLEARLPFNCEHVVPQSWFGKREPMKGDLHHLFTCESGCNSFRSNIPYWQFPPEDEVFRENCGQRETGERKFEPAAGKGAVARSTLYFLLRYPGLIGDEARELQKERLQILLNWHMSEEVGLYERHRNAAIYEVQGNRNPLIDHPEWLESIDFVRGFGD